MSGVQIIINRTV